MPNCSPLPSPLSIRQRKRFVTWTEKTCAQRGDKITFVIITDRRCERLNSLYHQVFISNQQKNRKLDICIPAVCESRSTVCREAWLMMPSVFDYFVGALYLPLFISSLLVNVPLAMFLSRNRASRDDIVSMVMLWGNREPAECLQSELLLYFSTNSSENWL